MNRFEIKSCEFRENRLSQFSNNRSHPKGISSIFLLRRRRFYEIFSYSAFMHFFILDFLLDEFLLLYGCYFFIALPEDEPHSCLRDFIFYFTKLLLQSEVPVLSRY